LISYFVGFQLSIFFINFYHFLCEVLKVRILPPMRLHRFLREKQKIGSVKLPSTHSVIWYSSQAVFRKRKGRKNYLYQPRRGAIF
jgi:hypothetical protein